MWHIRGIFCNLSLLFLCFVFFFVWRILGGDLSSFLEFGRIWCFKFILSPLYLDDQIYFWTTKLWKRWWIFPKFLPKVQVEKKREKLQKKKFSMCHVHFLFWKNRCGLHALNVVFLIWLWLCHRKIMGNALQFTCRSWWWSIALCLVGLK